ncbi:hypothetical protein E6W39_29705 [Kitasatospora acidiphila]|uniref:Uncharacterized protein n=1 Tax=Kitasatospora acidiphila TaxID=2567942 RepID=A0A540W9E3_9ACTN|nr:hypothetical protein [Kitasatospora acidiphila]TQF05640.1 hypothetical protein E6W39_29705 [Kitasatospora acidiphila]
MTAAPSTPWSVTLDYSHDVALALAVRDAFGYPDPFGLPPVDPPVALELRREEHHDPVIAEQWRTWWERAMAAPTHQSQLARTLDGPLGVVIHRNSAALLAWRSARKRELARLSRPAPGRQPIRLADAIRDHSRQTGTQFSEFHLTITAIPAGEACFQPIRDDVIAASIELIRDRGAYVAEIIEHLVRRQA